MPAVSVSDTYFGDNNPFSRTVFDMSLMPNRQDDEGNFFGMMGMIGMTDSEAETEYPIHKIQKVSNEQAKRFRSYLTGFLSGEPDIGDGVASDTAQGLDRKYFDFSTVAVYSISLDIPDDQINREQAVPIVQDYSKAYRQYWGNMVEEFLMTVGLAGMRGQSNNYEVMTELQLDSANAATGQASALTRTMQGLSVANPIHPAQLQFASWHSTLNSTNPLNPAGATSSDVISFTDIRAIRTYLQEQNRALRGVALQPGRMSVNAIKKDNSNAKMSDSRGWIWLVTPAVKRSLYDATGSGTMAEYQLALVQSEGHKTGIEDYGIGKLFGMNFIEYRKVPRYLGGASNNVPITRTIIMGRQAACFGVRSRSIPRSLTARFNQEMKRLGDWGVPVSTWVTPVNKGRKAQLHGQANLGVSALHWTGRDGVRIDKGRMTYDCATSTVYDNVS